MRKPSLLIWLLFCAMLASAQNKVKGYEYWFDSDYNNKARQNVTATPVFQLNTQITTDPLVPGLHSLHVRFFDDSSRYSAVQDHYFFKMPAALSARSIVAYQYWLDNDLSSAETITVSNQAVVELNTLFNSSQLVPGLHSVQVRFKDNHGYWSSTYSQAFYRLPATSAVQRKIVRSQLWFDDDFASHKMQGVTAESIVLLNVSESASALPAGLHKFTIRLQDEAGFWSNAYATVFYRLPDQSVTGRKIVRWQYWFDDNLAAGVIQQQTGQVVAQVNIEANANALAAGMHIFQIRFQDDAGFWSGTHSQHFYKPSPVSVPENLITSYQYWINENDAQKTVVQLPTAVNPFNTLIQTDLTILEAGKYAIRFQFKDSRGQWSIVTTDSITVQAFTVYTFTGNGNWSNAANWANGAIPPSPLPEGKEVLIDHIEGGECIMDIPQTIAPGARLTVKPGKKLRIAGNLIHQ